MIQQILIGVDGGASKTHVHIENMDGRVLGESMSGPANIRLSTEQAWQSIYRAINDILEPLRISLNDTNYRFHIGLGLAGCEVQSAVQNFLAQPHPFANLKLISDAHVACIGAHGGENGAVIIVGTGVVGYVIENNHYWRVGGWGFPHDDEGGGAWLGMEATRLTFQWLDNRQRETDLVNTIFKKFHNDVEALTQWANSANATEFATLAPIVLEFAKRQDQDALKLLITSAHAIDKIYHALIQKFSQKKAVCLLGGLAEHVMPFLNQKTKSMFTTKKYNAHMGAIFMMRQQLRGTISC